MSDPEKEQLEIMESEDFGNEASSQAMDAALQSSFVILKVVIAVLVVYLVFSNTFTVEDKKEGAIILSFGKSRKPGAQTRLFAQYSLSHNIPRPIVLYFCQVLDFPIAGKTWFSRITFFAPYYFRALLSRAACRGRSARWPYSTERPACARSTKSAYHPERVRSTP